MSGGNRSEIMRLVLEIAASQHGLISRSQALALGFSPRAVDRRVALGLWVRVFPGVYCVAGRAASPHQDLQAAYLWLGEPAVVSHRSAAAQLRLLGFEAGIVELTTDRPRTPPGPGVILHHTNLMPAVDLARVDGFTVTSVARTLLDLGAVVAEEQVEIALDDALRRHLTSVAALEKRLDEIAGRGRRGAAVLRRLVEARASGRVAESILEAKLVRLIRKAHLPAPTKQLEILLPSGSVARVDLAYPGAMLAIEADGFKYHGGRSVWQRDLHRGNALMLLGWRVVHFTWEDVETRQNHVVATIRRFLSAPAPNSVGLANKNGIG